MSKLEIIPFDDIFQDNTKLGKKIKKEHYLPKGKHPIIDQGQEAIAGYSNSENGVYTNVPAIIFGDHTRIIKYVEIPFFLGADGVKLLNLKRKDCGYRYLFHYLVANPVINTGYNRHFKWLRELRIMLPPIEDQMSIAAKLDTVSEIIQLHKTQLDELLLLSNSLMQEFLSTYGKEC